MTEDDGLSPDDGFDDTVDNGKADDSTSSVPVVHRFADPEQFPEGGAFDPVERAFYVGSLRHGNIVRVAADGSERVVYAGTGESGRFTLGTQVDSVRRRLWVCTTKDSLGRVWMFDLVSGERMADIDLTSVNPVASCNDILLNEDGSALVSDRENSHIYLVDPPVA